MASLFDVAPGYAPRANGNIRDLILMGGEQRARAAQDAGQNWAHAIQGVGNAVSGGIQAYQADKQEKQVRARDSAMFDLASSWDGKDQKTLLQGLNRIGGPQEAMKVFKAVQAFHAPTQDKPEDELRGMKAAIDAIKDKDDATIAKSWGPLIQRFGQTAQKTGVIEHFQPEWTPDQRGNLNLLSEVLHNQFPDKEAKGGGKKFESGPMGIFNIETGEVTAPAPVQTPKPESRSIDVQLAEAAVTGDKARYEALLRVKRDEAAAGRAPERAPKEKDPAEVQGIVSALARGDIGTDRIPAKLLDDVLKAAEAQGVDTRSTKQKDIDSGAQRILASLSQLEDQANKTITAKTPLGAAVDSATGTLMDKFHLTNEVKQWDAQAAKLSMFARQMGEKGSLSDKDIDRIDDLVPKRNDDVPTKNKKLADIREIIEAGLRETVSKRVKLGAPKVDKAAILAKLAAKYQ